MVKITKPALVHIIVNSLASIPLWFFPLILIANAFDLVYKLWFVQNAVYNNWPLLNFTNGEAIFPWLMQGGWAVYLVLLLVSVAGLRIGKRTNFFQNTLHAFHWGLHTLSAKSKMAVVILCTIGCIFGMLSFTNDLVAATVFCFYLALAKA